MAKKIILCFVATVAVFLGACLYTAQKIPSEMYFCYGEEVAISCMPNVKLNPDYYKEKYTASIFGVIPIKEVAVNQTTERYVMVSGEPFGIKMFCDGVMVVGFGDILTENGYQNPARQAGLKLGDIITEINGVAVQTNEDVAREIARRPDDVNIIYLRKDEVKNCSLCAVQETDSGKFKSGMWVRDSCAGVGTMTFYDTVSGKFAGLGHGIKDIDTQEEIRLLSGEIVPVKISGVVKSRNGDAGQLKGVFTQTRASGKILINSEKGVYGKYYKATGGQAMPVASPASVQCGRAQILTTINGAEPALYDVVIEKVSLNENSTKNMVIRVTDSRLLSLTGGIVRGMSGSPIIQNGALVGAVTHVFINQVDRGYGILAWNMLKTMDSVKENAA